MKKGYLEEGHYQTIMFIVLIVSVVIVMVSGASSIDPKVEIKNIVLEDFECIATSTDETKKGELIKSRQMFMSLLPHDVPLCTMVQKSDDNDTEMKKMYWFDLPMDDGTLRKVKYVQTFSHEIDGKKFKIWEYSSINNTITFYSLDQDARYHCSNLAMGAAVGFIILGVLVLLVIVIPLIYKDIKDTKRGKDENKENTTTGGKK